MAQFFHIHVHVYVAGDDAVHTVMFYVILNVQPICTWFFHARVHCMDQVAWIICLPKKAKHSPSIHSMNYAKVIHAKCAANSTIALQS